VPFLLIWPFILNEIIYDEKKLPKGKKKKYLFVYFLYSILCIISSLLSIPLYNLTSRDTPKWLNILYGRILDKYLSLDQLQQDVLFLIFTILVTIFISFFTMKKCRNYCDKNF
jgi:formate hydrogenlyase subunit 3/multisubunit Na+/H+ antiporter MnhD subunit